MAVNYIHTYNLRNSTNFLAKTFDNEKIFLKKQELYLRDKIFSISLIVFSEKTSSKHTGIFNANCLKICMVYK